MIRHSSRNIFYPEKVKKKKPTEEREIEGKKQRKGKLIKTERKKGVNNVKYAYMLNTRKDKTPTAIRATCKWTA